MFAAIRKSKLTYLVLSFYVLLVLWWVKIYVSGVTQSDENSLFGFAYSWIALIGGINGLLISKKYGGFNSLVGKGIIFFSIGLLGEWFGQAAWTYFGMVQKIEIPYPSIADVGFFSIIPFYALGMFSFAKAAGGKMKLKQLDGQLAVTLLPLLMLGVSYFLLLKNLTFDPADPIRTFLDWGYPIGEAITISIAMLTYLLTRKYLGGKMKGRILFLIGALVVQYITDTTFLYRYAEGTYYNAGPVDLMYATSFTIMTLCLIAFSHYD